jgi:carbon-monoxide dehydrogenase small subunit
MRRPVRVIVNGEPRAGEAEPRTSLADFLREALDLTGTHVGCEHGVCGACTVLLDGEPVRSCLLLAVQVDGRRLTTIEGLATLDAPPAGAAPPAAGAPGGDRDASPAEAEPAGPGTAPLHPLQEAFRRKHGLQCGFCTPGILLTAYAFLREHPAPTEAEIREMLAGNLCRCTGYQFIVEAIAEGARAMRR